MVINWNGMVWLDIRGGGKFLCEDNRVLGRVAQRACPWRFSALDGWKPWATCSEFICDPALSQEVGLEASEGPFQHKQLHDADAESREARCLAPNHIYRLGFQPTRLKSWAYNSVACLCCLHWTSPTLLFLSSGGNSEGLFGLSSTTGVLMLTRDLSKQTVPLYYSLMVTATDSGLPPLSTSVKVLEFLP